MTTINTNSNVAPFGSVAVFTAVQFVERVARAVKAKFVADRTYKELSKLSAGQLRDIGLAEQNLDDFCRHIARHSR